MTFGQPVRCLEDLVNVPLTDYLGWQIQASHGAVYQWDGKNFQCTAAFLGSYPRQIGADTFLPQWLLDHGLLVRSKLTLAGLTAEESELLLKELDLLAAELVVPIALNENLCGFLTLGPQVGEAYDGSEGLYLSLYSMNLISNLDRRQRGFETREERWFREGQKTLEEVAKLWIALKPTHSKVKLLVLDQEPEIVQILSGFFEKWGMEVTGTISEEAALEALGRRRPDILLLDFSYQWHVPERLIQAARMMAPEAVLLGTSTIRNDQVDEQVLRLGIDQIFRRPCFFARLAKEVFEAAIGVSLRPQPFLSPRPEKCLIVDEAEAAMAVQSYFEAKGFRVWSATGGENALQLAQTIRPNLVLLDPKVPGIQGPALLSAIRKASPQAKVIVLTAGVNDHLEKVSKTIRPDIFALKPIPLDELGELIEQLFPEVPLCPAF